MGGCSNCKREESDEVDMQGNKIRWLVCKKEPLFSPPQRIKKFVFYNTFNSPKLEQPEAVDILCTRCAGVMMAGADEDEEYAVS